MDLNIKHKSLEKKLKLGILINISFTIFEFIIGFSSGSLALISDAAQNLTDTTSLIISFLGHKISKKGPDKSKTFGYGRTTILSALLNGIILFLISIYIFSQVYDRFLHPEPIEGKIVMLIGFLGIVVNTSVALLFVKHKDDINIHSAFVNMIFDALASAAALLAGIIIYTTKSTLIDPIISIIIGILLIRNSFSILKNTINILLEGVPKNIDIDKVQAAIKTTPGIEEIQDLHIWAISSYSCALSCQIIVDSKNLNQSIYLVQEIKEKLNKDFNIKHTTIETNISKGSSCQINI